MHARILGSLSVDEPLWLPVVPLGYWQVGGQGQQGQNGLGPYWSWAGRGRTVWVHTGPGPAPSSTGPVYPSLPPPP